MKTLVICNQYDAAKCPADCDHAKPHKPIRDSYDDGKGLCNNLKEPCYHRADEPICLCVSVKAEFVLRSHDGCAARVAAGHANPLDVFIYENEPAGKIQSATFRRQLKRVIQWLKAGAK
jgi:hypothetical protein